MVEEWKDCSGWEGLYQVSDKGRVRSTKRKGVTILGVREYGGGIVKPITMSNGYLSVNFTAKGKKRKQYLIHRLVLIAFEGPPPEKHEACHGDGIRSNNERPNLRWDTKMNNASDKRNHGTHPAGENNGFSKLKDKDIIAIRKSKLQSSALSKKLNVSVGSIRRIRRGETWNHVVDK